MLPIDEPLKGLCCSPVIRGFLSVSGGRREAHSNASRSVRRKRVGLQPFAGTYPDDEVALIAVIGKGGLNHYMRTATEVAHSHDMSQRWALLWRK
jgi:hypothetical protein